MGLAALTVSCLAVLVGCVAGTPAPPTGSATGKTTPSTNYFDPGVVKAFVNASLAKAGSDQVILLHFTPTKAVLTVPTASGNRTFSSEDAGQADSVNDRLPHLTYAASAIDADSLASTVRAADLGCGDAVRSVAVAAPFKGAPVVTYSCGNVAKDMRWLATGQKVTLDLATAEGIDATVALLSNGWPATATRVDLKNESARASADIAFPAAYTSIDREDSRLPMLQMGTALPTLTDTPTPGPTFEPTRVKGAWVLSCATLIFGSAEYGHLGFRPNTDGHVTAQWNVPDARSATIPTQCRQI